MPWKETQKMDQRIEFVMKSLTCQHFGEFCREYCISRKTGYKWQQRFLKGGAGGLEELSRKPKGHAEALSEEVICEIVRLKQAHPHWGPVKIRELFRRKHPSDTPCESSFKRVLERAGLTQPRKRRPKSMSPRRDHIRGCPTALTMHRWNRDESTRSTICYHCDRIFLSESLGGWNVGLAPIENNLVEVRFANLLLGHLEPLT